MRFEHLHTPDVFKNDRNHPDGKLSLLRSILFYKTISPYKDGRGNDQHDTFCQCQLPVYNGSFTFVSGGELSLDTHSAEKSFSYPGGYYEGMELFLDIEELEKKPPTLFQKVLFRISDLQDKYCPEGRSCVTQAEEQDIA